MRHGREATAARRQASRLAGLVQLPASWQEKTAARRKASRLASPNPLASYFPKSAKQQKIFNLQGVSMPHADCGENHQLVHPRRKIFQSHRNIPIRKG